MAKGKDKSEIEHLRGENRELQKELKRLRSRLRQFDKSKHLYHDVLSDYEEMLTQTTEVEKIDNKKPKSCEICHAGTMEEFEILDKVIGTCNSCGHRKRIR